MRPVVCGCLFHSIIYLYSTPTWKAASRREISCRYLNLVAIDIVASKGARFLMRWGKNKGLSIGDKHLYFCTGESVIVGHFIFPGTALNESDIMLFKLILNEYGLKDIVVFEFVLSCTPCVMIWYSSMAKSWFSPGLVWLERDHFKQCSPCALSS